MPSVAPSLNGIAVALVVPVSLLWLAGADASAQTSYPLICKPGADMMAEVRAGAQVKVKFQGAASAASESPPSSGQCAWLDRGFRTGEPTVLAVAGNASHATYLADSLIRGETFYAHVYNDGKGSMVVTRIGP